MEEKQRLRQKFLKDRDNFSEAEYSTANEEIFEKLKDIINSLQNKNKSNIVGLYYTIKGEPQILDFSMDCNWQVALPKIYENNLKYVRYNKNQQLEKSQFSKLMQPKSDIGVTPDIIVAPGLAFSLSGYRLGFGVGHYDRYIADLNDKNNIVAIGVCFHNQLFDDLPCEQHDMKFNYVITNKTIIKL